MASQSDIEAINNQISAVETSLFALVKAISDANSLRLVAEKNRSTSEDSKGGQMSREENEIKSICTRLSAIQKSLVNFTFPYPLPADDIPIGQNCRTEKVSVGWRCVRWGSTGNGGSNKCLEYEEIFQYRFVCD